jgi:hypothetical protein
MDVIKELHVQAALPAGNPRAHVKEEAGWAHSRCTKQGKETEKEIRELIE